MLGRSRELSTALLSWARKRDVSGGWWGRSGSILPLRVLWAVGAKAGEDESVTEKQVVRLDLAIAGDSWTGEEKAGSRHHFPQEQRGQTLQDIEARWAGMSSCLSAALGSSGMDS